MDKDVLQIIIVTDEPELRKIVVDQIEKLGPADIRAFSAQEIDSLRELFKDDSLRLVFIDISSFPGGFPTEVHNSLLEKILDPVIYMSNKEFKDFSSLEKYPNANDFLSAREIASTHFVMRVKCMLEMNWLKRELAAKNRYLEEKEILFRTIISATQDAMIVINEEGKITLFNQSAERIFGWREEEIIGEPVITLMQKDLREDHLRFVRSFFQTGKPNGAVGRIREFKGLRKNGSIFPMEMSLSDTFIGKQKYIVGVARDISERKHNEEVARKLELRMVNMQKLESLRVLAGGVAHDFNNVLQVIGGNASLCIEELEPDSRYEPYLNAIQEATLRATNLTKQMLAFSGKGRFILEPVRLNDFLEEQYPLIMASLPKRVELEYLLSTDAGIVEIDPTQFRQLLLDLTINASEAIAEDTSSIIIRTGKEYYDDDYLQRNLVGDDLKTGYYAYLEVEDNGVGMDSETLGKLFDPFFTTKFTGRGLGMASVMGIVRSHHGGIVVNSVSGKGTCVKILLPSSSKSPRHTTVKNLKYIEIR